ncbi:hypothetical protein D3C86_2005910 [compost metagenome]
MTNVGKDQNGLRSVIYINRIIAGCVGRRSHLGALHDNADTGKRRPIYFRSNFSLNRLIKIFPRKRRSDEENGHENA